MHRSETALFLLRLQQFQYIQQRRIYPRALFLDLRRRFDQIRNHIWDVLDQYAERSIFAKAAWDEQDGSAEEPASTADSTAQMILEQIRYILHDPHISRARKMLVLEQFRNPELAELQTRQNYTDVLRYFTGLVKRLIRSGALAGDDPEIMAAQLCLPISSWINLCDREPDREPEIMALVNRHIRQFFKIYQKRESLH